MSSTDHTENLPPPRQRRTHKRSFRTWVHIIRHWILTHPLEMILVVMLLLAIILFINPLPELDVLIDKLPIRVVGFANNLGKWVAYEGGAQLSGSVFILVAISIVLIRARQIFLGQKARWSNVCPNCEANFTLKRIRRSGTDKFFNLLQLPTRRYRCKSCQWEGRRIDEDRI